MKNTLTKVKNSNYKATIFEAFKLKTENLYFYVMAITLTYFIFDISFVKFAR